jgi:uncharacterized protein involved in response to NO
LGTIARTRCRAWISGRVAITLSDAIGALAAAVIDTSFLLLVIAAAAREIIAGQNWRNLKVLIPVMVLALGNVGFHAEAYARGAADYGIRIGTAAILILVMLIGGRVVPSFTHNWLVRKNPGRLPLPFGTFDAIAIALSGVALAAWIIVPVGSLTAMLLFVAGVLQMLRLARWAGDRTVQERLVLVLHVAYAFVPLGFLLAALAAYGTILPSAGMHAWMVGAAGMMTLAVMTRASLAHTGRPLVASLGTQMVYAAVFAAAIARVAAALLPAWIDPLVHIAGFAWIAAFAGFAALYAPLLLRPHTP